MTTSGPRRSRPDARGRSTDGPVPLSEALAALSERIGIAAPDVLSVVFGRWEQLVGEAMAVHVRPLKLQNRTLVLAADHPAWATQVRHLATEIVAKIAEACAPAEPPERLEVRVRA
jgi:predicted nucleic acid-binding Zn ribbon protein